MFQAGLDFRDFSAPHEIVGGALVFGSSFVRPIDHRMVRWRVLSSPSRLVVMAAERFCDDEAPSGDERQVADERIDAELAALESRLLDAAALILDRRAPRVRYLASPVPSAPACIYRHGHAVLIDWDYARLLEKVTARPSLDVVLAQLAGRVMFDGRTVVDGMHRVTPSSIVTVSPTGIEAVYPLGVEYEGPQEVLPGADLEAALFDTVTAIIAARPLSSATTAVEVSGGMDSALTSLAAAEAVGGGLLSVGARFAGAMGAAQEARRRLIVDHAGFDDLTLPAERFAPFAPGTARRRGHNVLPEDENYPELFEVQFAAIRSAGADTLVSGFGGDELYAIYEGEETRRRAPEPPSPFLTAAGLKRAAAVTSDHRPSWLQPTSWHSAAARCQRVLRFGLWPIYPYFNTALARFVSCLPYEYRRDRTLLRKTLTRMLGDPVFETAYRKETFGAVARRGIEENRAYLREMVRANPLFAVAEVDGDAIVRALERPVRELEQPAYESLFRTLKLFTFFNPARAADDRCATGPSRTRSCGSAPCHFPAPAP